MSLDEQVLTKVDDVLMAPEKGSGSVDTTDDSNRVKVDKLDFQFEGWADKLIILIDDYRSGFECQTCNGTTKVRVQCGCVIAGRPGLKNRFSEQCEECHGDYQSKDRMETCTACGGKGALLVIPQTAKSLPTTGTIVSVGELCKLSGSVRGRRVAFSPHTGTMIPLKGNVRLKIMREHECLCSVFGEGHTSKFMDYDVPLEHM